MNLALENLTIARGAHILARDLNINIAPGETLLLTGANGSGKTTLLRVIAGLLRPLSGAVRRPDSFHWLGTDNALKVDLTVRENLRFFCAGENPQPALEKFAIATQADTLVRHLSTGQKRRISLSRLFLQPRPLWLLDEPATGLDNTGLALLKKHVQAHNQTGGIAIIATHEPDAFDAHHRLHLSAAPLQVAA